MIHKSYSSHIYAHTDKHTQLDQLATITRSKGGDEIIESQTKGITATQCHDGVGAFTHRVEKTAQVF